VHTELGRSQVEVQRCTLSWSLAVDDPDNTDSDTEVISRPATEQPPGDTSSIGKGTEYFDVQEDAFYFQAKAEGPRLRSNGAH